jgi:transposase-like protein
VKSSSGELELSVPRDRNGKFEPQVVKKYQTDIIHAVCKFFYEIMLSKEVDSPMKAAKM